MSAGKPSVGPAPASEPMDPTPRGRLLTPITAGVIRQALQYYCHDDSDFTAEYFPNVSTRGFARYDDVFNLDQRQAEALVPMLESSVRRHQRLDGKERARNTHLIDRVPIDADFKSAAAQKAEMWAGGLRDLCRRFDMRCPV
jgi:hypothetical protein